MKPLYAVLLLGIVMLVGCLPHNDLPYPYNVLYDPRISQKKKSAIYAHMKRHGINRDNVKALALIETSLPYSFPYTSVRTEDLFESGEHYRFEIDEFILTMKAPSPQYGYQWILPYLGTRNPDPEFFEYLEEKSFGAPSEKEKKLLDIADRQGGYHRGTGQKWCVPKGGFRITYRMLDAEEQEDFSTLEKLQAVSGRALPRWKIPSGKSPRNREEVMNEIREQNQQERMSIEQKFFNKDYYNHKSYDNVICIINGRYWIRRTFNPNEQSFNPRRWNYIYITTLSTDRVLRIIFDVPNYETDTDRFMFSADSRQKAFADIEEMVASIRVAKIDDDGSPDPFVIERVEPAPLPVRELLPAPQ